MRTGKRSEKLALETMRMEQELQAIRAEVARDATRPKKAGPRWRAATGGKLRSSDDVLERQAEELVRRVESRGRGGAFSGVRGPPVSKKAPTFVKPSTTSPSASHGPKLRTSPRKRAMRSGGSGGSGVTPASSSSSSLRSRRRPGGSGGLVVEEAESWDVKQVGKWLGVLGLDKLAEVFEEHAVSGDVLLDVGADDLDYMGVKALGHRKALMKGISQLRIATGRERVEVKSEEKRKKEVMSGEGEASGGKVHWSEAAIQAEKEKGKKGKGGVGGVGDVLDEDAEHASFVAAVMEWRKASSSSSSGEDAKTTTKDVKAALHATDAGIGTDGGGGDGGDGGDGGVDEGTWVNPFAKKKKKKGVLMASAESERQGGGRLMAPRASCYQCLRQFQQEPGRYVREEDKVFCSKTCHQTWQDEIQRRKERVETLRARRVHLEDEDEDDTTAEGGSGKSELDDDGEEDKDEEVGEPVPDELMLPPEGRGEAFLDALLVEAEAAAAKAVPTTTTTTTTKKKKTNPSPSPPKLKPVPKTLDEIFG